MPEESTLLSESKKLGTIIAQQPAVQNYRTLARQLDLDIGAKNLLQQFEQAMELVAMKEASMQPIEIAEKQKIEAIQQSVAMHPLLKKLLTAQVEYMDLMQTVQEAINSGVTGNATPAVEAKPESKLII
ncbi:MAG: YlbF family regulator [Phycisphaerales bacterium]|nr:YlbF family regulator [Phycisphaerales bacterium]